MSRTVNMSRPVVYYAIAEFHPIEGPVFSKIIPSNAPIDIHLEFEIANTALHVLGLGKFSVDDYVIISHSFDIIRSMGAIRQQRFAFVLIFKDHLSESLMTKLEHSLRQTCKEIKEMIHSFREETQSDSDKIRQLLLNGLHKLRNEIEEKILCIKPGKKSRNIKDILLDFKFIIVNRRKNCIITNIKEVELTSIIDKGLIQDIIPSKRGHYFLLLPTISDQSNPHSEYLRNLLVKIINSAEKHEIHLSPRDIAYLLNKIINDDLKEPTMINRVLDDYFSRFLIKTKK